jgi:membrane fusion protein, heavy metal efflux system
MEAPYELSAEGFLAVREDLVPLLKFTAAAPQNVQAQVYGYGKLDFASGASYAIRVPFDGIVESVEVERGDEVKVGQFLAKLRSRDLAKLRSDLPRLSATLVSEQDALKRLEGLLRDEAASERDVIEARSRVKSLEAEIEGIRVGLTAAKAEFEGGDTYWIKAEREGQILERNIHPGEQIESTDSEPEFIIGDPRRLVAVGQFPERDAALLKKGQPVTIRVTALRDESLAGQIHSIVRRIESDSRTTRVSCNLFAPDQRLQAQMSVRIDVSVEGDSVLVVPHSAVLLRRESRIVLVKHGERQIERRSIQVGQRIGDFVQVLSGISEGEQVLVENAVLLDGELDRVLADN